MKYRVYLSETTHQSVIVEADSGKEAETKAHECMFEDGFNWDGRMETKIHGNDVVGEHENLEHCFDYISEELCDG